MAKKDTAEIDIKIGNLDKIIEVEKAKSNHPTNFWIFGSALAMILSYERSASILWAILHGIISWFYVIYRAMQTIGWI